MACNGCGTSAGLTKEQVENLISKLIDEGKLQAGLKDCEGGDLPKGTKLVLCSAFADMVKELIEIKREPTLTLVYDMFDRSENGSICFLLDSQFAELACGRYNAKLVACGCEVYNFQIDKRESVKVSQVSMDNRVNCCEGKYGC